MSLRCCTRCFADKWLRNHVREVSSRKGTCDYCRRTNVAVVGVGQLHDDFKRLLELYVPSNDPHGEPIVDLMQDNYEIFDETLYESGEAGRLLQDIVDWGWDDDDGEPPFDPHELYYRRSSEWSHTTLTESWEEFCDKVKKDPTQEPEFPELFEEDIARAETVLAKGTIVYRARVGFVTEEDGSTRPFQDAEIGAPPAEKVKAGRANTEGDVVLYVADQKPTAVAEVRPWRGLHVSVAEIRAARDLRLVDLDEGPPPFKPFTDDPPQYWQEMHELLAALGEELGRPLRRADDPRDYLPCQKLVGRIRNAGFYDGIRYPSAMMRKGTNIVLFDPTSAQIGPSEKIEVTEVAVSFGPPEPE